MLKYVGDCKKDYEEGRCSKLEYVKCVLRGANRNERDEKIVKRATKVLFDISKERGGDAFIPKKDIAKRAEFEHYKGSGLWPWLEKNADVVEKDQGRRAYRIRKEFYRTFEQVFSEQGR